MFYEFAGTYGFVARTYFGFASVGIFIHSYAVGNIGLVGHFFTLPSLGISRANFILVAALFETASSN